MTAAPLPPEKRRRALLLLQHGNVSRLDEDAKLVYTVGLIICEDDGHIDTHRLEAAVNDPSTRREAVRLLKRAGVPVGEV